MAVLKIGRCHGKDGAKQLIAGNASQVEPIYYGTHPARMRFLGVWANLSFPHSCGYNVARDQSTEYIIIENTKAISTFQYIVYMEKDFFEIYRRRPS